MDVSIGNSWTWHSCFWFFCSVTISIYPHRKRGTGVKAGNDPLHICRCYKSFFCESSLLLFFPQVSELFSFCAFLFCTWCSHPSRTAKLSHGFRQKKLQKYFIQPLTRLAKIVSTKDGFINRVREQLYPISWPWCNYLFQHIWDCDSSYVVITQRTAWDLDDSRSVLSVTPWANLLIPLLKQN